MLEQLKNIDDDLPVAEFDPAKLVGEIKDKIDAIKWRLDNWAAAAQMIEDKYLTPLGARVDAIWAKHERLREYVKEQMLANDCQKLPGKMFRCQLNPSKTSLEIKGDPKVWSADPHVISEMVYKWDRDKIAEDLALGMPMPFEAKLKEGKSLNFYVQAGSKDK